MLPNQDFTPEEILRMAWRRRWALALPTVVIAGVGLLYISRIPDLYQSETMIMIVPQRVPESYVRTTVTSRIQDRLQSIQQQIFSRSRLERVILDFDLYPAARARLPMEDVVVGMRGDVDVLIERGDAFRVKYRHPDPVIAQQVTERLASLFIEENLRDREVLANQTSEFLESELNEARSRLIEQERKLESYRRQYSGQLPDQVQSNLQAIAYNQTQLRQVEESLSRDVERRLALERQLADLQLASAADESSPVSLPGNSGGRPTGPAPSLLDDARAQLRGLEARYTQGHPDVVALRRKVRELEAAAEQDSQAQRGATEAQRPLSRPADTARANREREVRESLQVLSIEIKGKEAEQARLREAIGVYQSKVDAGPTRQTELTELTRDYETMRAAYTGLLGKREESKIAANLERRQVGEQFKVLDPARVPERPFYPKRLQLTLMAIAAGVGVGGGLAALLEYLDQSFRTAADVTRLLGLPVLASIPRLRKDQRRRRLGGVLSWRRTA